VIAQMPCPSAGRTALLTRDAMEASRDEFLSQLPDGEEVVRLIASETWEVRMSDVWVTDKAVRWSNGCLASTPFLPCGRAGSDHLAVLLDGIFRPETKLAWNQA
jgi:hypothetical protein